MNDWRLMGQEGYLKNIILKKQLPSLYVKEMILKTGKDYNVIWHEHCEFCTEKITAETQKICYSTEDDYHWICEKCYNDFKEMFQWKIKK